MPDLFKWLNKSLGIKSKPAPARTLAPHSPPQPTVIRSDSPVAAWQANQDIIAGLKFCATMQPRIPLRVLARHGETHTDLRRDPPAIALAGFEGIWIPFMHGQPGFGGSMASTIGPIPTDGGEFLLFLITVRKIVEKDSPIEDRACELKSVLKLPEWRTFARKLKSPRHGDLVGQFFPRTVDTIPGLPATSKDALVAAKLDTAAKIAQASDATLLAIKGLGKAKLDIIRAWQLTVSSQESTRQEDVER